ncbi:MAG: DUF2909 domain-containing protein [Methylococcaceae bacterium]
MMIKTIIILVFVLIIASLAVALFHLVNPKDEEHAKKTVNALTFRISLSLILFIALFIAVSLGIIKPHGLGITMQNHPTQKTPATQ